MRIEQTLADIESFFAQAAKLESLESARPRALEPVMEAEIVAFEKSHGLTLPEDVRVFWLRGLKYFRLTHEDDEGDSFATAGFDWIALPTIERDLPAFRELSEQYAAGNEKSLIEQGVPLTFSEPQLIWTAAGVSHFSTRNDLQPPVAASLTEFLEHWLESGCFCSHDVTAYLAKVRHLVPGRIREDENLWMRYYRDHFG